MDQTSSAATDTVLQYGVLGVVAIAFAWAIIQLFKTIRADDKAMELERRQWAVERGQWEKGMERERGQWAVERENLRLEYERKHRELLESYAKVLRDERDSNRAHEDLVRNEFADLMDQVATSSCASSEALVDVMQKFYDRLVGPRGR